jgi:hypothetical protein
MASLTSNPKVQLAATAVVSAAVAAGALLSYQRLQQGDRVSRLKQSIPQPSDSETEPALQSVNLPSPLNSPSPSANPFPTLSNANTHPTTR